MKLFDTKRYSKKEIKRDQIIFLIWPLVAAVISFVIKTNFFFSTILFFLVPSLYLSYKNRGMIKKSLLFSGPALIIVIVIDYICEVTGTWFIPYSIFGDHRFLGKITFDIMIWFYLYVYFIVMYYEYFLEHKSKDKLYTPKLKYLYAYFTSILILFLSIFLINHNWFLKIRYFYMIFGIIIGLLPIVVVLFEFPNLLTKFVKTGVYFFFLSMIYEITAVSLNQWSFPGRDFIGHVKVFNTIFPFEELFFWIILGSISILCYYEFFDDDIK